MNSYSLSADSRRWWWPSAAAGVAGTAVITAILVLPTAVQAQPELIAPAEPAPVFIGETHVHQCYMLRLPWNEALDGHQPRCSTPTTTPASGGIAVDPVADDFSPRPNAW